MKIEAKVKNEELIVKDVTVQVSPEALQMIDTVDSKAAFIQSIDSDEEYEEAKEIIKEVDFLIKQIDKSRTECKKPYLAAGRSIDDVAKKTSSSLVKQDSRIRSLIQGWLTKKQSEQQKLLSVEEPQNIEEFFESQDLLKDQKVQEIELKLEVELLDWMKIPDNLKRKFLKVELNKTEVANYYNGLKATGQKFEVSGISAKEVPVVRINTRSVNILDMLP